MRPTKRTCAPLPALPTSVGHHVRSLDRAQRRLHDGERQAEHQRVSDLPGLRLRRTGSDVKVAGTVSGNSGEVLLTRRRLLIDAPRKRPPRSVTISWYNTTHSLYPADPPPLRQRWNPRHQLTASWPGTGRSGASHAPRSHDTRRRPRIHSPQLLTVIHARAQAAPVRLVLAPGPADQAGRLVITEWSI